MCRADQRSLIWSADQVLIRQGVTALLRNLFMGSGPLIFHTLICGRGGGKGGRGVQSPEFNKSDLLVMICILNQKWRLARPCCFSPDSFVRRQKVSDSIWHSLTLWEAGSYQVRPEPTTSEATRTLTSFLSSPQHLPAARGKFCSNLGVSFKWSRNIAFVWFIM